MKRKLVFILICALFIGCESENSLDCSDKLRIQIVSRAKHNERVVQKENVEYQVQRSKQLINFILDVNDLNQMFTTLDELYLPTIVLLPELDSDLAVNITSLLFSKIHLLHMKQMNSNGIVTKYQKSFSYGIFTSYFFRMSGLFDFGDTSCFYYKWIKQNSHIVTEKDILEFIASVEMEVGVQNCSDSSYAYW